MKPPKSFGVRCGHLVLVPQSVARKGGEGNKNRYEPQIPESRLDKREKPLYHCSTKATKSMVASIERRSGCHFKKGVVLVEITGITSHMTKSISLYQEE
jgi:hypothetical protein